MAKIGSLTLQNTNLNKQIKNLKLQNENIIKNMQAQIKVLQLQTQAQNKTIQSQQTQIKVLQSENQTQNKTIQSNETQITNLELENKKQLQIFQDQEKELQAQIKISYSKGKQIMYPIVEELQLELTNTSAKLQGQIKILLEQIQVLQKQKTLPSPVIPPPAIPITNLQAYTTTALVSNSNVRQILPPTNVISKIGQDGKSINITWYKSSNAASYSYIISNYYFKPNVPINEMLKSKRNYEAVNVGNTNYITINNLSNGNYYIWLYATTTDGFNSTLIELPVSIQSYPPDNNTSRKIVSDQELLNILTTEYQQAITIERQLKQVAEQASYEAALILKRQNELLSKGKYNEAEYNDVTQSSIVAQAASDKAQRAVLASQIATTDLYTQITQVKNRLDQELLNIREDLSDQELLNRLEIRYQQALTIQTKLEQVVAQASYNSDIILTKQKEIISNGVNYGAEYDALKQALNRAQTAFNTAKQEALDAQIAANDLKTQIIQIKDRLSPRATYETNSSKLRQNL